MDFNPSASQPNDEKFRNLVLFISQRSIGDKWFGAVKLNKLLFYADFFAYLKYGNSITGHEYQKLENGPAPRALLPILQQMEEQEELKRVTQDCYGRNQTRTIALQEPNLDLFTAREIALVTEIIDDCWDKNAKEMSLMSHEFPGWRLANDGETVPYESVLCELSRPSTDDVPKVSAELADLDAAAKNYFANH